MAYRYFSALEFLKCVPSCSIDDMDKDFMDRLETARSYSSVPFVLNSAFRSIEYEREHRRSGSSSHCLGVAVDIRCTNDVWRLSIVKSLLRAGFRRLGIYESFIHVDSDPLKPQCIWYGKS